MTLFALPCLQRFQRSNGFLFVLIGCNTVITCALNLVTDSPWTQKGKFGYSHVTQNYERVCSPERACREKWVYSLLSHSVPGCLAPRLIVITVLKVIFHTPWPSDNKQDFFVYFLNQRNPDARGNPGWAEIMKGEDSNSRLPKGTFNHTDLTLLWDRSHMIYFCLTQIHGYN